MAGGGLAASVCTCARSDNTTDLVEKVGTAMYESDPDDRFEGALRLSEVDPVRVATRLRSICASDEFDRDTRDEAAHRLSELEPASG